MDTEKMTQEELNERTGFPTFEGEEAVEEEKIGSDVEKSTEEPKPETPKAEEVLPKTTEEEVKDETPKPVREERHERTVPYGIKGRLEKEVAKRKELENSISDKVAEGVKIALASLVKADKNDALPDEVKKAANELAQETGFDEDGVEKLLRKAKELSATNKIPDEVAEKLKELDVLKAERDAEKK